METIILAMHVAAVTLYVCSAIFHHCDHSQKSFFCQRTHVMSRMLAHVQKLTKVGQG